MTVNDASLGESGSKLSKVAATSLLMGVTRASSEAYSELGISPWNFYDAKRKYAPKEEEENAGEFLQLIPGGSFLPNPIKPSRSRSSKQKESAQETVAVNIELRTPTGTMMRISGNLTGLRHGDPAHKYLRAIPTWRRGLLTGFRDGTPATGTSEPSPQGHCYLVNRIVAEMGFVKFTWHEPLLIIK